MKRRGIVLAYCAGIVTAFAAIATGQAIGDARKVSFDEIDVHRINVVEPDGTLRMTISNRAQFPGAIVKGKELPHASRNDSAGMIFFNDEGTENGGLIFGGERSQDGTKHSSGHLSFDAYEQDQTMALDSTQSGGERSTRLQITDYPDYSILDLLNLLAANQQLPAAQQKEKLNAFLAERGAPTTRLVLGRGMGKDRGDNSVMLGLNDMQGHPRIVMKVASDGTPSLQMFDTAGNVVGNLDTKAHP